MRKYKKLIKPILVLALLMVFPVYGGGVKKIAQTGMKWLSIPIGARGSALGGAFTAYSGDASSIFWNPAAMGFSEGKTVFLSQTQWIADININAGAASYRMGNIGVFGVSLAVADWGTFHGTRRTTTAAGYEETGDFSPSNWSVGVGYSLQVSEQFSFGGHIKYLHEKLGETLEGTMDDPKSFDAEMNLIALDVGTLYYTGFKDLRFGMSLQNFSPEKAYRAESYALPLTFKFGLAMDIMQFFNDESPHAFTFSVDAIHPRDYTERLHFGGEYSLKDMVFIRCGYKTNYDEEDFSFGGGLNLTVRDMVLGINYSYINFEYFDIVHMFSFDFKF